MLHAVTGGVSKNKNGLLGGEGKTQRKTILFVWGSHILRQTRADISQLRGVDRLHGSHADGAIWDQNLAGLSGIPTQRFQLPL